MEGLLDGIARAGYENLRREDDYEVDGLLYCGKCHTRKERYVTWPNGQERKVMVMCTCEEIRRAEAQRLAREGEEQNRLRRLKTASLIDQKYEDVNLTTFTQTDENKGLFKLCSVYVDRFQEFYEKNQGILFYGSVGTGKSYAAACIVNELLDRGKTVLMTSLIRIIDIIRKGPDAEDEIMRQLSDAKLVVFDDFGSERNTEYALEKVYDVVDARYRARKPMIVTTNVMLRDMANETDIRYKRVYDRIFEVCYPMEVKGKSWRRVQANEKFKQMREILEDNNG